MAVRWVDINKGDETEEECVSRLGVKEFRAVDPETLFAATPPAEALRNGLATDAYQDGQKRTLTMRFMDIRWVHFKAKATREMPVQLQPEIDRAELGCSTHLGNVVCALHGINSFFYVSFIISLNFHKSRFMVATFQHLVKQTT